MNAYTYLTKCNSCGETTSKKYAKSHEWLCKQCAEPESRRPTRNERILDHGYLAYAIEEDHFGYCDR